MSEPRDEVSIHDDAMLAAVGRLVEKREKPGRLALSVVGDFATRIFRHNQQDQSSLDGINSLLVKETGLPSQVVELLVVVLARYASILTRSKTQGKGGPVEVRLGVTDRQTPLAHTLGTFASSIAEARGTPVYQAIGDLLSIVTGQPAETIASLMNGLATYADTHRNIDPNTPDASGISSAGVYLIHVGKRHQPQPPNRP